MDAVIDYLTFVARNVGINAARAVVPFSLLKTLFPRRMSGRGGGAISTADKIARYRAVFTQLRELAETHDLDLDGAAIAEIGPGDNVLLAAQWLGLGVRRVYLIDRFDFLRSRERLEAELAELGAPADALDRIVPLDPVGPAPEPLALVYSNAVLEHVQDLPSALGRWRAWLKPGGWMLHYVDLKSHGFKVRHELDFLNFPKAVFWLMSSNRGVINRLRWSEHRQILHAAGFELRDHRAFYYPDGVVGGFTHRRFAREDLRVAAVLYLASRTG